MKDLSTLFLHFLLPPQVFTTWVPRLFPILIKVTFVSLHPMNTSPFSNSASSLLPLLLLWTLCHQPSLISLFPFFLHLFILCFSPANKCWNSECFEILKALQSQHTLSKLRKLSLSLSSECWDFSNTHHHANLLSSRHTCIWIASTTIRSPTL